jgi:hypothetical protein
MVSPTILKGRRISQIIGNRKSITRASGQQITRRINQSTMATKVLMLIFSMTIQIESQFKKPRIALISALIFSEPPRCAHFLQIIVRF